MQVFNKKYLFYNKKFCRFAYALLKRALEDKTYYFEDLRINWLRYGRKDLEAKILKIQLKACILNVYGLLLV